jgi:hypothetical protein
VLTQQPRVRAIPPAIDYTPSNTLSTVHPNGMAALRASTTRSLSLLSSVLKGQGKCQGLTLAAGRQQIHTSSRQTSIKQCLAAHGAACQGGELQQQQLWRVARQVSCGAAAGSSLAACQAAVTSTVSQCSQVASHAAAAGRRGSAGRSHCAAALQVPLSELQLGFAARFLSSLSQADKQPAQQQKKEEVSMRLAHRVLAEAG